MNKEEIYSRLKGIFMDVFDNEEIELTESTESKDIDGWDSLMHITLIGVIEDEFGIRFDMECFSEMKKVSVIVDMIQELI